MYVSALVFTSIYWYGQVHTSQELVCTGTDQYKPVHTGMYTFCSSLISLFDTGFRGSHRDDAMQAPAPAQPTCEEGDLRPCREDEAFFESRPDAADMEEAISKFMEGMEREECTGYNALHKLLQTLPVPEEKDSDSMTQAEAFQGGFLRELDEDEKKRFTPSELILYKHALEYRYMRVHTSTYVYKYSIFRYIPVHTGTYRYVHVNKT